MNTPCNLEEMTWEEVREKLDSGCKTVLIPFGSTEQHGPHLPLGTDTMVAATLARDAAARTGTPAVPPLWFGWSPHHMVLAGTITIRPEILVELAFDIIQSLYAHGFRNFVLINGHRIVNISWLQMAGERAKRELDVKVAIFDPAYMSKSICKDLGWGAVGHAEEIETSHMLHRHPNLVKMDRAIDHPHPEKPLYSVDPSFTGDTLCYVPSTRAEMEQAGLTAKGTFGEPTNASAKGGEAYHEHLVNRLMEVIKNLENT